ncbi:MAG: molybdate ABC transporter permease subunit [Polyangiales bacterium]
MSLRRASPGQIGGGLLAATLVFILGLPLIALGAAASFSDVRAGMESPLFAPALWLSLRTSALSLLLILLMGTPLAWWLSRERGSLARIVGVVVDIPIIVPPAVMGIALLMTFGQHGVLAALDLELAFTTSAVVVAQVVVAAPFYVQASVAAFRKVPPDIIDVGRTLGASPFSAFLRVAIPVALPGLVGAASLAWARALGEFGATLLFAGSLRGETQTMPLAIFSALESDLRVALAFALALTAMGVLLLVLLRAAALWRRR